jgi:hypothetical protein
MLLDRGSRTPTLQELDIGGDMHRLDAAEFANPLLLAPVKEVRSRAAISRERVFVADVDGEEFEEAPRSPAPAMSAGRTGPACVAGSRLMDDDFLIGALVIGKLQQFAQLLDGLPFHFDAIGTDLQTQLATAKGVEPGTQPRQRYESGQKSDDGSDR